MSEMEGRGGEDLNERDYPKQELGIAPFLRVKSGSIGIGLEDTNTWLGRGRGDWKRPSWRRPGDSQESMDGRSGEVGMSLWGTASCGLMKETMGGGRKVVTAGRDHFIQARSVHRRLGKDSKENGGVGYSG
jgi:hypothetical protein